MASVLELQTLAAAPAARPWRSSISLFKCGSKGRSTLSGAYCVIAG